MTMFPAAHRQNLNSYGGGCCYNYDKCFVSLSGGGGGGSDLDLMADDQLQGEESRTEINSNIKNDEESRTEINSINSNNTNTNYHDHEAEMIKKEEEEDGDEWLQLSLGSTGRGILSRRSPSDHLEQLDLLPAAGSTSSGGGGGDETNLSLTLTAAAPRRQHQHHLSYQVPITTAAGGTAALFIQPHERGWAVAPMALTTSYQQYQYQYQYDDTNYMAAFRPNYPLSMTSTASLAGQVVPGGRPLDFHTGPRVRSMDFRVVDPPPRPHSGVWFILQASLNQIKEPYLPQVPKSYLRIKDGRTTTVGLVIKYLVDKLKLDSQFQIEITCKGQQLLPFLTLQHVRDNIWNRPRNDVVFSPSSTTIIDHLMVLNYGRIA